MKGSVIIDRKKVCKLVISILLIFSVLAMSASAAEEEEEEEEEDTNTDSVSDSDSDYTGQDFLSDHMNVKEAKDEVENGPAGKTVKKINKYVVYGYLCLIVLYMIQLLKWFYVDGGEGKTKAYIGAGTFVLFIMFQWSFTVEALNTVAGV